MLVNNLVVSEQSIELAPNKLAIGTYTSQADNTTGLFENTKNLVGMTTHLTSCVNQKENAQNLNNNTTHLMTCVSQEENAKNLNSKFIDPIMDEMYFIHFQPFYDFSLRTEKYESVGTSVQSNGNVVYYTLSFKSWEKCLLNPISLIRSISNV